MRARGIASVVVTFACLGAVPALGAVQPGDPPALLWVDCYKQLKPCGDPLVIAAGRLPGAGRYETVGMDTRLGLCLGISTQIRRSGGSTAGCGGHGLPEGGEATAAVVYGWSTERKRSITQIVVAGRPDVTDLRLRYRKGGEAHHVNVPVAPVDGDLLAGLGQSRPFGLFTANLRGCADSKITVTAYGEAGRLDQMRLRPFRRCGTFNGGGFAIFARQPQPSTGSKLLLRRIDHR